MGKEKLVLKKKETISPSGSEIVKWCIVDGSGAVRFENPNRIVAEQALKSLKEKQKEELKNAKKSLKEKQKRGGM